MLSIATLCHIVVFPLSAAAQPIIINTPQSSAESGYVISQAREYFLESSSVADVNGTTLQFEAVRNSAGVLITADGASLTNRGLASGNIGVHMTGNATLINDPDDTYISLSVEPTPGSGDFPSRPAFYMEPFSTGLTMKQYYRYNTSDASYLGPADGSAAPDLPDRAANFFFVDAADGLAFVAVFGKFGYVPAIGGQASAITTFDGGNPTLLVEDDNFSPSQEPESKFNVPGTLTSINGWGPGKTDGFAVGGITESTVVTTLMTPAWGGLFQRQNIDNIVVFGPNGQKITLETITNDQRLQFVSAKGGVIQGIDAGILADGPGATIVNNNTVTGIENGVVLGDAGAFGQAAAEDGISSVTNGATGTIVATGGSTTVPSAGILETVTNRQTDIRNDGAVSGRAGIRIAGDASVRGATDDVLRGTVTGTSAEAIRVDGRLLGDLINGATVQGATSGLWIGDLNGKTVTNLRTIAAEGSNGTGVHLDGGSGVIVNRGTIAARGDAIRIDQTAGLTTTVINEQGAEIRGDSDTDALGRAINAQGSPAAGLAGIEIVENAGAILGDVFLGAGNDILRNWGTGTITGLADGGAGTDRLLIETAFGQVWQADTADYTGFETVDLNVAAGSTGTIRLEGPNAFAVGGGALSSVTLHRGSLAGHGWIAGSLAVLTDGVVTPGNSIGTISVAGNYSQSGIYRAEYRAPAVVTNLIPSPKGGQALAGLNTVFALGGSPLAASLADQDADLVSVIGTAALSADARLVLVPVGYDGNFAAALQAGGNSAVEIRYLILRSEGGGTGRLAGVALGDVAIEYQNDAGDVIATNLTATDTTTGWTNAVLVVGAQGVVAGGESCPRCRPSVKTDCLRISRLAANNFPYR